VPPGVIGVIRDIMPNYQLKFTFSGAVYAGVHPSRLKEIPAGQPDVEQASSCGIVDEEIFQFSQTRLGL